MTEKKKKGKISTYNVSSPPPPFFFRSYTLGQQSHFKFDRFLSFFFVSKSIMLAIHRKKTWLQAFQTMRYFTTFQEGDFCMLRQVRSNKKIFAGPLCPGGQRGTKEGVISHDCIIGKKPRSLIKINNGIINILRCIASTET